MAYGRFALSPPRRVSLTIAARPWSYNIRIPAAQEVLGEDRPVHTAEHLAAAMFYLGVPRCEIPRARLIAAGAAEAPSPYCCDSSLRFATR
jgi:heptosyltransferase-3